jgi:hypothetical protein
MLETVHTGIMVERRFVHVPVASNAHSLVAGTPVESVRRRLKIASLLYDGLILEAGAFRLSAGPNGSTAFRVAPSAQTHRWQTARERGIAERGGSQVSIGLASVSGQVADAAAMQTFYLTKVTRAWDATLQPFDRELPAGCNWIEWVGRARSPEVERLATPNIKGDVTNPALMELFPDSPARSAVIKSLNEDMVVSGVNGMDSIIDPLHARILDARLAPGSTVPVTGFALPILIPSAARLGWETIAQLRKDRHIQAYRRVMADIEAEAAEIAACGGDLEAAVQRSFRRRSGKASERLGAKAFIDNQLATIFFGLAGSGLTFAVTGPEGWVASAVVGSALSAVLAVTPKARRRLAAKRWLSVSSQIDIEADELTARHPPA